MWRNTFFVANTNLAKHFLSGEAAKSKCGRSQDCNDSQHLQLRRSEEQTRRTVKGSPWRPEGRSRESRKQKGIPGKIPSLHTLRPGHLLFPGLASCLGEHSPPLSQSRLQGWIASGSLNSWGCLRNDSSAYPVGAAQPGLCSHSPWRVQGTVGWNLPGGAGGGWTTASPAQIEQNRPQGPRMLKRCSQVEEFGSLSKSSYQFHLLRCTCAY